MCCSVEKAFEINTLTHLLWSPVNEREWTKKSLLVVLVNTIITAPSPQTQRLQAPAKKTFIPNVHTGKESTTLSKDKEWHK